MTLTLRGFAAGSGESRPRSSLLVGAGALVAVGLLGALLAAGHVLPGIPAAALVLGGIAGAGVLVAALTSPSVAALLLAVVVFARVFAFAGSDRVAPGLLALVLGAAAAITTRRRNTPDAIMVYLGVAGSYLGFCALTAVWSSDTDLVLVFSRTLGFQMLVGLGVVGCVTNVRHLRWALWGLIGAGFVVGLLAIWQYLTKDYANDFFGLERAAVEQLVGTTSAYRSGGPVGDANFFGQMMVVVVVAAMERTRAAARLPARLFAALTVLVGIFTVIITYSRGTVVALAIGVVLAFMHSNHRGRAVVVGLLVLLLAFAVLPSDYTSRLANLSTVTSLGASASGPEDPAIAGRSSSWIVASKMIEKDPIGGVGFGTFEAHYLGYSEHVGRDIRGQNRNAHSYPLSVLAETGTVGFAIMLMVLAVGFGSVHRARRWFRAFQGHQVADDAISTLGAVRDILIVYLVASVFLHAAYPQLMWFLLGLAYAARQCCGPGALEGALRPARGTPAVPAPA